MGEMNDRIQNNFLDSLGCYNLVVCRGHDDSYSNAEIKIYKNTSSTNQNPLFYIDIMGDKTGLSALIARDFKQLAETLNYLSGLLSLIRLDQSASIARSM